MESYYESATNKIKTIVKIIGRKRVVNVSPITPDFCTKTYPCMGHDGVILTFDNGTELRIKANSVEIGAFEIFFLPDRQDVSYCGSTHFITYINSEYANKLNLLWNEVYHLVE
jgi:hypothetical protein